MGQILKLRPLSEQLMLTNNGQLSVFPIGTGSAFCKKNFQNNYIIIKGDTHVQIDCGTRTPEALFSYGTPITNIRNYVVTHSHADHIGGLEEVILMGRYVMKTKPRIIINDEYQKILWEQSLRGGASPNERHQGRHLNFEDFWEILRPVKVRGADRDLREIDFEGLKLAFFRTMHYPDSSNSWKDSAYSIGVVADGRFMFTGDTRWDPDMIKFVLDRYPIEVIFHDVQFHGEDVHAWFENLKTLEPEIKAKTFLMHYPDNYKQHLQPILDAGFAGFVEPGQYYDFP